MRTLFIFVAVASIIVPVSAESPPKPIVLNAEQFAKLREIAFQAAREGDVKTLEEYFKIGRPLNETNSRGDTLLIVAAYNGQAQAVELILKQPKLEVDARNKMGLAALTGAAFKGHLEIAKALVKAKADVNASNESGQTALMFAALSGRTATVEYLLVMGANLDAKDKAGNTALSLAKAQGAEEVVKKLEAARKK